MASARRVAVTGLGLVSPFGGDLADFFGRMLRGESAIRLYTREDDVLRPLSVPAVRCANFDADAALGRSLSYTMDRYSQLGTTAALSAWREHGKRCAFLPWATRHPPCAPVARSVRIGKVWCSAKGRAQWSSRIGITRFGAVRGFTPNSRGVAAPPIMIISSDPMSMDRR